VPIYTTRWREALCGFAKNITQCRNRSALYGVKRTNHEATIIVMTVIYRVLGLCEWRNCFPNAFTDDCPSLIKGTVVYNVGYFYAKAEEISLHHPSVGFRSSSKQWTGMAILGKVRRVFRNLQSLGKPKAAGKTEQRLFVLKNLCLINAICQFK